MIELRDIDALVAATHSGKLRAADIVEQVLEGIAATDRPEAWLHVGAAEALRARAVQLDGLGDERRQLPLFGVPFAVKDNIDVAGMPTTAGCPAYAYAPAESAHVVARLLAAGAIAVGKTHMDQFATGLVGVRSPHGPCRNPHHPDYISGGSSSGSAVVVAQGLVSFALGTDTAGSGRVPAALCGIVGLKPTRGRISTRGVVPACASLDCVSIFAGDVGSAARVLAVAEGFDAADPFSRQLVPATPAQPTPRIAIPSDADLEILDPEGRELFAAAVAKLEACGAKRVPVDFAPFRAVAALLYAGPWVAERQAAVGDFIAAHRAAVDPTVALLIGGASAHSARDAFAASYELRKLTRETERIWEHADVLVVPTVPRLFRIAEVMASPLVANEVLGAFNNFMNLLDLSGLTLPTGVRTEGVPFGITLAAPAIAEPLLIGMAQGYADAHVAVVPRLQPPAWIRLVVVGAHLSGMPLNRQLEEVGARFESTVRTRPEYRLFALADTVPAKPGLVRVANDGCAIEAEVWRLPPLGFARFVDSVRRPLAIGRVLLEDGSEAAGFVCEPAALDGAWDISAFGGWRNYITSA